MTFDEYRQHDATALAQLVKTREVTPNQLLDLALKRTEQVNPQINAVVHTFADMAKEQIANLDTDAPFAGVPFLIKDLDIQLKGTRYTGGSKMLHGYVSTESTEVAKRILKGGLVVFGKSNTPEFGLTPFTEGRELGVCRNPWNTDHTTGGSSGGAGAAVAAGILPMAFASDGGGSIRIPASCCGLFGIKPSRGRISNGPLSGEVWSGAVTSGIVSRSVRDAAAYLDVVQGPLKGDPYIIKPNERPFAEELKLAPKKLKIGYSYQMPKGLDAPIDPENEKAIKHAVEVLRSIGHEAVEVELPFTHQLNSELLYTMVLGELSALLDIIGEVRGRKPSHKDVEPNTWLLYKLGKSFSANSYTYAKSKWNAECRRLAAFHEQYDMLLTPTLGRKPFKIGTMNNSPAEDFALKLLNNLGLSTVVRYTGMIEKVAQKTFSWIPYPPMANITGLPSMNVPLYWSADGLPVGVMFTGPSNDEATLLRLAAQLEQADPWFNKVAMK